MAFEFAQQFPALPESTPRRRGGLLRPLIGAASTAGRRAFSAGMGKLARDLSGEGYIDFAAHRCALDFGSYALVVVGDRMWQGRSGRPLHTLPDEPATWVEPLWLLDLVRGVADVEELGAESISGRECRHLRGHADLTRAAAAAPWDLPVPNDAVRYGDLLRLPLELWIDDQDHIRRLRQGSETAKITVELVEFGVEVPVDWSRLPTFRSPEEAAELARRALPNP